MRKSILAIVLTICLCLSLTPVAIYAGSFPDMPAEGTWSYAALKSAVENGLLQGNNGKLDPSGKLTRAQMAAIVTRAFGATETSDISGFTDIVSGAWYYDSVAKAVKMGIFQGGADGKMNPNQNITREQAFAVLARAFKLENGDPSVLDKFADKDKIASYAVGPTAAMVGAGYVNGNGNKLDPKANITRAQFAVIMYNMIKNYINKTETYSADMEGNAIVSVPGVVLQNMKINGDLVIGEGVGDGELTLDGVTVTGRLIVRGGGENSIIIKNSSSVGHVIVAKTGDNGVRIHTEEGCRVEVITVNDGKNDVILDGTFNQVNVESDVPIVLKDATITGLNINAEGAKVETSGNTSVVSAVIADTAKGANLSVNSGAKIVELKSDAEAVSVSGSGKIETATVSGNDTKVDVAGTKVTVASGVSGVSQNGQSVEAGTTSSGSTSSAGSGGGSGSGSTPAASVTKNVYTISALSQALASGADIINLLPNAGDDSILFVEDDNYAITVSAGQTLNIGVPMVFRGNGSKLVNNGKINIEYDYLDYAPIEVAWGWNNSGATPSREALLDYFRNRILYYQASGQYKEATDSIKSDPSVQLYIENGTRRIVDSNGYGHEACIWFDDCDTQFINKGTLVNKVDVWFTNKSEFINDGTVENYGVFGFQKYSIGGINNGTIKNYYEFSPISKFTNNGTILSDVHFGMFGKFTNAEGATFTNNGDLTLREASLVNNGTIKNNGNINARIDEKSYPNPSSIGNNGTLINDGDFVLYDNTKLINAGTFVNGSAKTGNAFFRLENSSFENTGSVTSNIYVRLFDSDFKQSGSGTFENSGGMTLEGGSFDLSDAAEESFKNTHNLQIYDYYYDNLSAGSGSENNICDIKLGTNNAFKNSSNNASLRAYALSADGFTAATDRQNSIRPVTLQNNRYYNLEAYNQLIISFPMVVSSSTSLNSFREYDVWGYWSNTDQPLDASITIKEGATLTLGDRCSLFVSSNGELINNGNITSSGSSNSWITMSENGGSYIGGGSATVDAKISFRVRYIQDYEADVAKLSSDQWERYKNAYGNINTVTLNNIKFGRQGEITNAPSNILYEVYVCDISGLKAAIAGSADIKPQTICATTYRPYSDILDLSITLESDLTIPSGVNVQVNDSVDFTVPNGIKLIIDGEVSSDGRIVKNGEFSNFGDTHIYGDVIVKAGGYFYNGQNIDLGAASGSENASIDVEDRGNFYNEGYITVYQTGDIKITEKSWFTDNGTITDWTSNLPNINQTYSSATTINVNTPSDEMQYRNCTFEETVTIQADSAAQVGTEVGNIRFYNCKFKNGIVVVYDGAHQFGVYFNGGSTVSVKNTSSASLYVTGSAIVANPGEWMIPKICNIQGMSVQATAPCSLSADGEFTVNGLTVTGEYLGDGQIPWGLSLIHPNNWQFGIGCNLKDGKPVKISVRGNTDADIVIYGTYNSYNCEGTIDLSELNTTGHYNNYSTSATVTRPASYTAN